MNRPSSDFTWAAKISPFSPTCSAVLAGTLSVCLMASFRRASKDPCIFAMPSCFSTMACSPSFTEPTISIDSSNSTTRLLSATSMLSIWLIRDFKVKTDVAKMMPVMNMKPPATPIMMRCCFLLTFIKSCKPSVAFFIFSATPAATLAERVANSAESSASIFRPSSSSASVDAGCVA